MNPDDELLPPQKLPHPLDYVGMFGAFAPFVLSFTTSGSSTVDGQVASAYSHNWAALVGGGVALLFGALSLLLLRTTPAPDRTKRIGLSAMVLVFAVVQLVVRSGFVL